MLRLPKTKTVCLLHMLLADTSRPCRAETVLALMRNPEYSIYGAAKVDNEGGLDAGEDRFNEVHSLAVLRA